MVINKSSLRGARTKDLGKAIPCYAAWILAEATLLSIGSQQVQNTFQNIFSWPKVQSNTKKADIGRISDPGLYETKRERSHFIIKFGLGTRQTETIRLTNVRLVFALAWSRITVY